ncbi:MAG TPA: 2-oxo acid dehydrogenase subunit E2 [Capsulimonadaceae bacterium]|jgi:pyruvate/2-oxoglutarate dehydrogenase complex dihydrolipoamide acyltransferase (E2) component
MPAVIDGIEIKSAMKPIEILTVPQLGEGLRTVKVVQLLKHVGEEVAVDEPIYEIETDKALVLIESPVAGTVVEWLVEEDSNVAVHAPIARLAVDSPVESDPSVPATSSNGANGTSKIDEPAAPKLIPPRTRAYCKQKGIADDVIALIPAAGRLLTEADVDAYIAASSVAASPTPAGDESEARTGYTDFPLSDRQMAINRCALMGNIEQPLPAVVRKTILWDDVLAAAARVTAMDANIHPTPFQIVAYCATHATMTNPKFRSVLLNGQTVRRYDHISMGFAVPLPEDELTTAVVHHADTLELPAFMRKMRSQMRAARKGLSQADDTTTLLLTTLMDYDIVDAVPILVPPAVAVLFIGSPHSVNGVMVATLTLTIDHRLINGIGAAAYLASIITNLTALARPEANG